MESEAFDLKSEREKKKISLSQIAADTRISLRYLRSIEEGRFSDLPGGMYNRAFIKAYCESIHLNPQQILEQYEAQASPAQSEKMPRSGTPDSGKNSFSIPSPIIIWSILLLISTLGIYLNRGWISDLFSNKSTPKSTASPSPSINETFEKPDNPLTQPNTLQGISSPSSAVTPSSIKEPVSRGSLPVDSASVAADSTVIREDGSSKLRLEIIANQQCWIEIYKDGVPFTKKLMEPGEEQFVQAEEQLQLLVGNAGGVLIKLNNKQLKPLGEPGEVVRMDIDVQNLEQFISSTAE